MDRRELLKMIAVVTGGAVIGSEFFLTGCTAGGKADVGFTPGNIALLDEVGETILPATTSPGAKAAQVGEFMKVFVTDCYPQESQDAFVKGINELDEACKKMHSKSFMDCTPEQRRDLLISLEKEAKEYNKAQEEKDKPRWEELKKQDKEYDFVASPKHYYTMMKQLTLLGFFTSKPGATQALRHEAVPGKYDGALPYKKGDKAWAE
ncbi:MAG: gluconate 2-dehydrogenase subunit 3 family protein [Chitinophagaceae bacterium]|nr:gluconate 2-dehydrogenase subunit 3 family protein [Chitinophagaceae bacterium]